MSMKKIAESFSDLKSTEIINAEKQPQTWSRFSIFKY